MIFLVLSILWFIIVFCAFITGICTSVLIFKVTDTITSNNQSVGSNLYIVLIFLIILLLIFVAINILNFVLISKSKDNFIKKDTIILSILGLNIVSLIYWSLKKDFYEEFDVSTNIFVKKIDTNKLSINKTAFKITTNDITIMALLLAIYFTLDFISSLIPVLPFWITLSFKYVPLFFAAWMLPMLHTFIVLLIVCLLEWLIPGTYVIFAAQYLFDYALPTMSIICVNLLKIKSPYSEENKLNKLPFTTNWVIQISLTMLFFYIFRVISGAIFFKENAGSMNPWVYSMVYNFINTTFDYLLLVSLVPTVCLSLNLLKRNYLNTRYSKLINQ